MNGTVAILGRELMARRDLLLVAAAAAVMALLMPLLPGLEDYDTTDVWTVSSNTLALVLGWGLALGLGATVFGGDLSEGRLGFYFARPVKGLAVWSGRMLAVVLLVFVCEALVLLPSLYGGGMYLFLSREGVGWPTYAAYFGMPLLLVLLAHAVSIMVRARTAWLFLDLVGFVAAGAVGWMTLRPLVEMNAEIAFWVVSGALVAALVLALAAAGAVGVVVGRTDLRRIHGALSITLWCVLAVTVGAVGAYAGWLRSFEPGEVDRADVLSVSPTGEWVEIFGSAPGRLDVRRRFLISTTNGRWLAIPHASLLRNSSAFVFSIDGGRAAWLAQCTVEEACVFKYVDLEGAELDAVSTKILVPPDTDLELSPDGTQMAFVEDGILSVYELTGERLVTAVRLPEDLRNATKFYLDSDTIRLYGRAPGGVGGAIRIAEVLVGSGEIVRTGEIAEAPESFWAAFDSGVEIMAIGWTDQGSHHSRRDLHDARSGELIRTLGGGFPRFLSGGRIAALREEDARRVRLVVESPDGTHQAVYDLGVGVEARLGGEALPGELMVTRLINPAAPSKGWRADLFDLETGNWRPVATEVERAWIGFEWKWGALGSTFWFVDQPAAARLLTDRTGALVRWDPDSGELIHIVGARN